MWPVSATDESRIPPHLSLICPLAFSCLITELILSVLQALRGVAPSFEAVYVPLKGGALVSISIKVCIGFPPLPYVPVLMIRPHQVQS